MRTVIVCLSIAISVFTAMLGLFPPAPDSNICLWGGCRFDQLYENFDSRQAKFDSLPIVLLTDAANPSAWATYAEALNLRGETEKAAVAMDQAKQLGPGIAAVWMRSANFDFVHGRHDQSFVDAAHILMQTSGFDEIVFSYLTGAGVPVSRLLGSAVPEDARSARAWLQWARNHGSENDLVTTWSWMREKKLADEKSAVDLARTLWQHKAYKKAQDVWVEWLGERREDYLRPQFLTNRKFATAPTGSPLDWTLDPSPSVRMERDNGLSVRFLGKENIEFGHVRQSTVVPPGRYHFAAEISAEGITTDEGPYWRIVGIGNSSHLAVETEPIKDTVARSWISAEFTVGSETEGLEIQLRRRKSQKFDNKITGELRIYELSLVPVAPVGRPSQENYVPPAH
jgi:hypothetical protein